MLQAQVNYWTLMENKRHNEVGESQTWKSLEISERDLSERSRHNRETEALGWSNLAETSAHNRRTEAQTDASLNEAIRTHMANEAIGRFNAESNRTNALANMRNANTNLANYEFSVEKWNTEWPVVSEQKNRQLDIESKNANTNSLNAITRNREADIAQQRADTEASRAREQWMEGFIHAFDTISDKISSKQSNALRILPYVIK